MLKFNKSLDIAWPFRTAVMKRDFGRDLLIIIQVFCFSLELVIKKRKNK